MLYFKPIAAFKSTYSIFLMTSEHILNAVKHSINSNMSLPAGRFHDYKEFLTKKVQLQFRKG